MATINVQAGAAAHVVDRRPAAAKEALAAIQRASAEVLDELAAMLGLLRDDGRGRRPAGADARLRSDPRPGRLDRDSRLPVTLEQYGPLDAVPEACRHRRLPHRAGVADQRHPPRRRPRRPSVTVRVEDRRPDGRGHRRRRRADAGPPGTGMGIRACASEPRPPAAPSRPGPGPGRRVHRAGAWPVAVVSAAVITRRARRRPGAGAGRLPRCCSTPRTTSRSSARPTTAPRRVRLAAHAAARRRADGRPHAGHRRSRGATARIAADDRLAGVKVLVLTTFELDEYVFEAMRARGQRLPRQAHPTGRSGARRPRGRAPATRCCRRSVTRRLIEEFAPARSARTLHAAGA